MRFHFKQIERSLTEKKQLFRTLWICALQGRVVLAPYNAWLVDQVIVDIRFLLHTQLHLVPLHTKTGLVWSISKAGMRGRILCGHLQFTLLWLWSLCRFRAATAYTYGDNDLVVKK